MNDAKRPKETIIINDLDTLKVVADPLRAQILEVLNQRPATVKQIAEKLGLTPNNLYYHINLLEKHDLISVAETRMVANMLEKVYRAEAENLDVDPDLLNFTTDTGKETINTMLTSTLDTTREDILRSLQARYFKLEQGAEEQPRRFIITRSISRMDEGSITEFQDRLYALIQEFGEADDSSMEVDAEHPAYAFMVALYPTFYFPEPDDNASTERGKG